MAKSKIQILMIDSNHKLTGGDRPYNQSIVAQMPGVLDDKVKERRARVLGWMRRADGWRSYQVDQAKLA